MPLFHSKVYGIVQGVGFRPFVARLADEFSIYGSVANKGPFVEIFAAGALKNLEKFYHKLEYNAPERSTILRIDTEELNSEVKFTDFNIIESAKEQGDIFVSPDIAICDKCTAELFDKNNRRYLHPFINCTACGPRLTILEAMPYDRERTSMKEFPMCPECRHEYNTPTTRRYDAQPVCCNDCGPEVYVLGAKDIRGASAITRARKTIIEGGIIAIKGIGGFHLCCDATNNAAIARLRNLKHRPVKPFAIMARNIAAIEQECLVSAKAKALLTGHQKPIVLLPRKDNGFISDLAAPQNPKIGMMLPYTPLHLLLFEYPDGLSMPSTLIMTSGNPAGAPICRNDVEAEKYLTEFTDLILSHNRKIIIRADDTVTDFFNDHIYMVRRSRGFAPLPIMLSNNFKGAVLGIGGELKNTFCIGHNNLFYPSPYIGDMGDLRTVNALKETITRLTALLETTPTVVACDMHPNYNTSAVARELGIDVITVQHHYAHILSCMAENDCHDKVIGFAFDGTGYGLDKTIWGGEILLADFNGFTRLGHIAPFKQAGGDKSSIEGWRIAAAMLYQLYGKEKTIELNKKLSLCSTSELSAIFFMLDNNINTIASTSVGRLFDAVSAILNIKNKSTFEGEASMYLEFAAEKWHKKACSALDDNSNKSMIIASDKIVDKIVEGILHGAASEQLAYEFHLALANEILRTSVLAREKTKINIIALSGGVFQNTLLLELVVNPLKKLGFKVLLHRQIPPNDGGIALGQAVFAMQHINKKE